MEEKTFSVAVIGGGSRGLDSYSLCMRKSGHFKLVSVCDKRQVRLDFAQSEYGVDPKNCYLDENELKISSISFIPFFAFWSTSLL